MTTKMSKMSLWYFDSSILCSDTRRKKKSNFRVIPTSKLRFLKVRFQFGHALISHSRKNLKKFPRTPHHGRYLDRGFWWNDNCFHAYQVSNILLFSLQDPYWSRFCWDKLKNDLFGVSTSNGSNQHSARMATFHNSLLLFWCINLRQLSNRVLLLYLMEQIRCVSLVFIRPDAAGTLY